MDQLFGGAELFGPVAFGDGAGEVAFAVKRHAEGEAGVEVAGGFGEDGFEFALAVGVGGAEEADADGGLGGEGEEEGAAGEHR